MMSSSGMRSSSLNCGQDLHAVPVAERGAHPLPARYDLSLHGDSNAARDGGDVQLGEDTGDGGAVGKLGGRAVDRDDHRACASRGAKRAGATVAASGPTGSPSSAATTISAVTGARRTPPR